MITTVAQFIAEQKKAALTNEEFETSFDDSVEGEELDNVENTIEETEEEVISLSAFTAALNTAIEVSNEELEEGEEPTEQLTEKQLELAFAAFMSLNNEEEKEENQEEMEDAIEEIEEGKIGDFFRGGSKEEIAAKAVGTNARLDEVEEMIKAKGLPAEYQEYADNKRFPYNRENLLKIIAKNNYLGTIETHTKADKLILIYRPGQKGMNALAAGSAAASGMTNNAKNPN